MNQDGDYFNRPNSSMSCSLIENNSPGDYFNHPKFTKDCSGNNYIDPILNESNKNKLIKTVNPQVFTSPKPNIKF